MVGGVNWISRVIWLSTVECVVPFSRDLGTSRNINNSAGHRLVVRVNAPITNQIVRGDIHDGLKKIYLSSVRNSEQGRTYAIVVGHPDTNHMSLTDTIDVELLEDTVSGHNTNK